jgi:Ser/Thr protein kinase RdoA (MazF antagonist)
LSHAPPGAPGYTDLTAPEVLRALDAVGLRGDGRILQLNSYENRVFQLFLEDGRAVVAKFYRPGRWSDDQIVEEHTFARELADEEISVVPPLALDRAAAADTDPDGDAGPLRLVGAPPTLAGRGPHRWAVAARCAGRAPDLDDDDTLRQLGRFIGRMHTVGGRRRFAHRPAMNPRIDGARALRTIIDGDFVGPAERPAWESVAARALAAAVATFEAVEPATTLRLHGDCHVGNVLWRDGGPNVVDLDDAVQGPAVQDLWMLVSGDRASMARQLDVLLEGYTQFSDFDDRERRLIEPLRTLRMLRHSAWLADRWNDPSFPINFPWFGTGAYWSQQTTQLREQIEAMEDAGG